MLNQNQETAEQQTPVPANLYITEHVQNAAKNFDRLKSPAAKERATAEIEWGAQFHTQAQRDRYAVTIGIDNLTSGTEAQAWHRDLILINRELNPDTASIVQAKAALSLISSTRWGRFMRAFSEDLSVAIPRDVLDMIEVTNGKATPLSRQDKINLTNDLHSRTLSGILVSPGLISNNLSVVLGLLTFEEGTSSKRAVELKDSVEVIDGLKMIFESTAQINPKNSRLWMITENVESKLRYPKAPDMPGSLIGTFIYYRGDNTTQNSRSGGKTGDVILPAHREIPCFYSSAYDLYRATLHKDYLYVQELAALASLSSSALTLNQRLHQDWRKGISDELKLKMTNEVVTLLQETAPVLDRVKHLDKKEAKQLLKDIQEALKPETGSAGAQVKNMQSLLPRIVAVRNRITKRGDDITRKNSKNTEDKNHLESYLKEQEKIFSGIYDSILQAPQTLKTRNLFFADRSLTEEEIKKEASEIIKLLNLSYSRTANVRGRPFSTFAAAINLEIGSLERGIYDRNADTIKQALVGLIIITKLAQASFCIERLKRYVTFYNPGFDSLEKITGDLAEILKKREIFPNVGGNQYQDRYRELRRKFIKMSKRFGELNNGNLNDAARLEKYQEIRDFLDKPENDIERVVAQAIGLISS